MLIPRLLPLLSLAALSAPLAAQVRPARPRPALAAPRSADADALRPSSSLAPPGGPRILMMATAGSPEIALRLSIPVREGPAEGGAARVIQLLALERARGAAAQIGARVDGARTPWGVAYTVVGAAADFDYLTFILRDIAAEPLPDDVTFERARSRALGEAQRLRETARGRVASALRESAVPGSPLVEGTPASVGGLTRTMLRDLWGRTHRSDSLTLVVVGDVPAELVLASLGRMGASAEISSTTPAPRGPTAAALRTEVIRSWYGEARVAGDMRDPRTLVAASLVGDRLRADTKGRTETHLEVWEVGGRRVLGVIGASYPGEARGLRPLIQGLLGSTRSAAQPAAVGAAVQRVRAGILLGARTPAGLASLVGHYFDATGDPEGAAALVDALDRVDATSIRAFLRELEARTPVRAEVGE